MLGDWFRCPVRAALFKGRVSMKLYGCFIAIGGGGLFSETPVRVVFLSLLTNYLYIYFEIIVSGCRSWNSLTSCPLQLWQP